MKGYLTNIVGHVPADTLGIAYDAAGRVYSLTDSQGYSITNTYDSIDRVTNSALPDGTTIQTVYNILNVGQVRGRDRRWTYYTPEANGRLSTIEDTAGHLYHYDWCGCGALEDITDPNGQITAWIRDDQNRPTQKLYTDMSAEQTAYEKTTSRVKQTTDAAGKSVTVAYNQDNTVQQIAYSGGPNTPSVSFGYDTNYNRLTQMVDGIGTNFLTYVPAAQPAAGNIQSISGPLPNSTINFGYDAMGRPLTLQIDASLSSVQYDALGRIYWSSNQLGLTTIQYVEPTGRPALVTQPNGLSTAFSYTPVSDGSRLKTMLTTNAAGTVIQRYDYVYDVRNLILTLTNTSGGVVTTWQYAYDLAQELIAADQFASGALVHHYSYTYDPAGNRTSEQIDGAVATEKANALNQLMSKTGGGAVRVAGYLNEPGVASVVGVPAQMTSPTNFVGTVFVGVGSYNIPVTATDFNTNTSSTNVVRTFTANGLNTFLTYDKAGNLVSKANSSQTFGFGWDEADRCTSITNGNLHTVLAYDGLSRWSRITEYSNAAVVADRRFLWNGTTLAEERDGTGTNIVKRFFSGGFSQSGTNYYYVTDQLGSVVAVTLANGTIVAQFAYDPYGRRSPTGTLWVDFGFAGLFEHQSGLKLAVWRIYDPSTDRWASRDPIREEGGWNVYAYCNGNPINNQDVIGLKPNLNLFDPHSLLFEKASRIPSISGVFLVTAHGNAQMVNGTLTAGDLAKLIQASPDWKTGMTIQLDACSTGAATASGKNFAQQLSDLLKVTVVAPDADIRFAETTLIGGIFGNTPHSTPTEIVSSWVRDGKLAGYTTIVPNTGITHLLHFYPTLP